jgi:hypothetical protein
MRGDLAPTARLRLVKRQSTVEGGEMRWEMASHVLQQWWSPDVPAYMQNGEGEWRDVPVVVES